MTTRDLLVINTLFGWAVLLISAMHHLVTGDGFWPCVASALMLLMLTFGVYMLVTVLLHGAIWLGTQSTLCVRKLSAKLQAMRQLRQAEKGAV